MDAAAQRWSKLWLEKMETGFGDTEVTGDLAEQKESVWSGEK